MDHTGKKYGHLTLVQKIRPGGHGVGAVWKAICDCGNAREVLAKDVIAGRVRTCGKCSYAEILRRPKQAHTVAQSKQLKKGYERLVRNCLTRHLPCSLSYEEYCRIMSLDCTYCGRKSSEGVPRVSMVRAEEGYTPRNCLPTCRDCRTLQGEYNSLEFLDLVLKIAKRVNALATQ